MKKILIVSALAMFSMIGCTCKNEEYGPFPKNGAIKTADGPLIQAHRLGKSEYDDNSAAGIPWCLERGIRGFELDIRYTKDHKLVVMHDTTVDRTTKGTGKVEDMTCEEICKLQLKKSGDLVPTAKQCLDLLRSRDDIFVEIEMKSYPNEFHTPEVLEKYCRDLNNLAKETLMPGTYSFTCFNEGTLAMMRKVDKNAPLGLITGGALSDDHLLAAKKLNCAGVAANGVKSTKEMVDKAHSMGLTVCLYMTNEVELWYLFKEKGADRITTDYAEKLMKGIKK